MAHCYLALDARGGGRYYEELYKCSDGSWSTFWLSYTGITNPVLCRFALTYGLEGRCCSGLKSLFRRICTRPGRTVLSFDKDNVVHGHLTTMIPAYPRFRP